MSALDYIRRGIVEGDFVLVCEGFRMLSGEDVSPPEVSRKDIDYTQVLMDLRSRIDIALGVDTPSVPLLSQEATYSHPCDEIALPEEIAKAKQEMDGEGGETAKPSRFTRPPQAAEEEVVDQETVRARAAKEYRVQSEAGQAVQPQDKFHIQHKPQSSGNKRSCKVSPFEPGMVNKFVDDKSLANAKHLLTNKELPEIVSERRPQIKLVLAKCSKCDKQEEVNPAILPKRIDKNDDIPSYICNTCIKRACRTGGGL